jgi:hypothetical protein
MKVASIRIGLYFLSAFLICAGSAFARDGAGMATTSGRSALDEPMVCIPDFDVNSIPYQHNANLSGAVNDCGLRSTADHIYRVHIAEAGFYTFSTCSSPQTTDTYLFLRTGCCSGEDLGHNNDGCGTLNGPAILRCRTLAPGIYYLIVEAGTTAGEGPYTLDITQCANPCETGALTDGLHNNPDGTVTFVQTVDANSGSAAYTGPYADNNPCEDGQTLYGFDHLCWYGNDFGWTHQWPAWNTVNSACIESVRVRICGWDVDATDCLLEHPGHPELCEHDRIQANGQTLTPEYLSGTDEAWSLTQFTIPPSLIVSNGQLHLWADFDVQSQSCNFAALIHRSQLIITYSADPTCGTNPIVGWDYGDLDTTCYNVTGTQLTGGPANPIHRHNLAWLGDSISADGTPGLPDRDSGDDGVVFVNSPWHPCQRECVDVKVTVGSAYEHQPLFLYGWKDGNLNCQFTDVLCNGTAPECIIQGEPILGLSAGQDSTYRFCFSDPGVLDVDVYDGVLRFRLLSQQAGTLAALTSVDPVLGETEDYVITDLQLSVELLSFSVVQDGAETLLSWLTASEQNNDHYVIERRSGGSWQRLEGRIVGAGSATAERSYSWRDGTVQPGTTYEYRLLCCDISGITREVATRSVSIMRTDPSTVTEYRLHANYPNPFNPSTTITFDLKESGFVQLRVYNLEGREIAALVNSAQTAGRHHVLFDAAALPSGVYLCRITAGDFNSVRKMVLLK